MLGAGEGLIQALDEANARQCQAQRDMLSLLPQAETEEVWALEGARDLAHWLSIRYGLSGWKAHRWIHAAHALEDLPLLSAALATGELGVDKVLELCRFARPETERRLLKWAQTVSVAAVRRRADREVRTSTQAEIDAHEARFLSWWYTDEGRRMGLQGRASRRSRCRRYQSHRADGGAGASDAGRGALVPARPPRRCARGPFLRNPCI
jgi:hypothetical protein